MEGKPFRQEVFKQEKDTNLENYKKTGEDFINAHKRLFDTFAEDVSISFKMGDAFFIDYKNGYISLDSKWFFEKGYNKEQILWATFHELSHFRDLIQDKEGVMGSFEHIKEKANVLSKNSGMDERLAYDTYHTLYNCLDDIYVNKVVSRNASFYEQGRQGGKHVEQLYKEKLFKDADYAKDTDPTNALPHHLQFAFYLLRKAMLPEDGIQVSEEVKNALQTRIEIGSKTYTPEELVQSFMVPHKSKDTTATTRHEYLKKYIEPIYESLIKKDLEEKDRQEDKQNPDQNQSNQDQSGDSTEESDEGNPEENKSENEPNKQGRPENGDGKEEQKSSDSAEQMSTQISDKIEDQNKFAKWAAAHKEFAANSPDQIDHGQMEKFAENEEHKREENNKKDEQSPQKPPESGRTIQANADRDWAERNETKDRDIYRELKELRQIEESILPHLNSLTELWQSIIAGRSREITSSKERLHASGSDLDVDSVIDNIGSIYAGQVAPRIYEKNIFTERLVEKPELIRVRLVVDKSGSMNDERKQKVLQQTLVLVLRSIQQLNEMLDMTRGSTGSKLNVETQVLGFSDNFIELKKLESDQQSMDVDPTLAVLNVLRQAGAENGSTYDNLALKHVLSNQDEQSLQKIKIGKMLDLLFEITDGGSSAPFESQRAVEKMEDAGIHSNAFQIGKVNDEEKRLFNQVWNNSGTKKGQVVGADIEKLVPAVTEALKKYLRGVQL